MVTKPRPCPRQLCGGSMFADEFGDERCSLCARPAVQLVPLPLLGTDDTGKRRPGGEQARRAS